MASLYHTSGNGFSLNHGVNNRPVTLYKNNGTGRDSYIGFDNGSNSIMYASGFGKMPRGYPGAGLAASGMGPHGVGGFNIGNNQGGIRGNLHPAAQAKLMTYLNDGTGRDTYIQDTNGGF